MTTKSDVLFSTNYKCANVRLQYRMACTYPFLDNAVENLLDCLRFVLSYILELQHGNHRDLVNI